MTAAAWRRLIDEERHLTDVSRRLGQNGRADEAPDSAAVAEWLHDVGALDRRLAAVREAVASAEIVEDEPRAVVGREVRVLDEGAIDDYRLVIPGAGNAATGAISIASPLGGALLLARPGDAVEFDTPAGSREVTIVEIGADVPPI